MAVDEVDRQQALGLYGALIIDPQDPSETPPHDQELIIQLQEWNEREGYTYPAMPMEGLQPNFFTINGKAYPATETVQAEVGDRLLIRFIGSNSGFIHPMHTTEVRSPSPPPTAFLSPNHSGTKRTPSMWRRVSVTTSSGPPENPANGSSTVTSTITPPTTMWRRRAPAGSP